MANKTYYLFDQSNLIQSHKYPITFLQFKDFYPGDSRLNEEGLIIVDYDNLKNLSTVRGIQISPILTGFLLVHQISRLNSEEADLCDSFRCEIVKKNLIYLASIQSDDGSWILPFDNKISGRINKAPWKSGLAQAFVVSAFHQWQLLTGDTQFNHYIKKGVEPFGVTIAGGGVLSINEYGNIIEEYPFQENNIHVLNGYMYAIITLSQVSDVVEGANSMFYLHIETLERLIAEYRLTGWSAYSLDSPTLRNHATYANPKYHSLHGEQLAYLCYLTEKKNICSASEYFISTRTGLVGFLVNLAYVVFQDLVKILK